MSKYCILLLALCLFVGCDLGEFDISNGNTQITPIETTQEEEQKTPTDEDTNENTDETFPGSVIIEGDKAEEVIQKMEKEFWLSEKGVLHNSLCRWYKKCAGKVWDNKEEHTNCKNCGGDSPIVREWNLNKLGEDNE